MGADWAGASDEPALEELDAAILFAPVGALVPAALRAVRKGGTVVCGGIHMSDIPGFPYDILWGERSIRSVANLTRRDGEEFFDIVGRAGIRTDRQNRCRPAARGPAVGRGRSGQRVTPVYLRNAMAPVDALTDLFILRRPPKFIRSDNGPEFIAEKVRAWIADVGTKTALIERGSPWENGYCESCVCEGERGPDDAPSDTRQVPKWHSNLSKARLMVSSSTQYAMRT